MPSIIQDEKQALALKEIEQELLIVDTINQALMEGTSFSINAGLLQGKPVKIDITEKDRDKITSILFSYRKRLAKDINSKAATYRISLSETELESIRL